MGTSWALSSWVDGAWANGTWADLLPFAPAQYTYVVPVELRVYTVPFEAIETLADRTYLVPDD